LDHVPNEELTIGQAPDEASSLGAILEFALSYNAYEVHGSSHAAAQIANRRASRTLDDLRTCLFFEARRWRHFGEDPDAEAERYIRGIVRKIRVRLSA